MLKKLLVLPFALILLQPIQAQERLLVVVDPGHGGQDPGVTVDDLEEKDLVMRASLILADEFLAEGFDVRLTRTGDESVPIPDRRAMAEEAGATLFISLHMNFDETGEKHGIEMYANMEDEGVASAARKMGEALEGLDMPVVIEGREWGFLRAENMPVLMIEAGFMSHMADRRLQTSPWWHRILAKQIVAGAKAALTH